MTRNFNWLVSQFLDIINVLVLVVFAVTFVVVLWQILNAWIINGGDSTKVEEGKKTIFWSILVLVAMSSVWGIVALLRSVII